MTPCPPHHIMVESPHGPTTVGRCKWCDYTRIYRSSLEDTKGTLVTKSIADAAASHAAKRAKDCVGAEA